MHPALLFCCIGLAFAAPQYEYHNYAKGQKLASFPLQVTKSAPSSLVPNHNANNQLYNSQHSFDPKSQSSYLHPTPETVVSKFLYSYAAPEEAEEEVQEHEVTLGPVRKNYRVVFIKAPVEAERKTALRIAQPQTEEKTAIYVLTKKSDPTEIQAALQATPTSPTKPEVYFIKYKTLEEAAHAQQQIQAHYDALGGTSEVSDEGYAPVSSVVGAFGGYNTTQNFASKQSVHHPTTSAPYNPYLPAVPH